LSWGEWEQVLEQRVPVPELVLVLELELGPVLVLEG
jgi:hypothetical protein